MDVSVVIPTFRRPALLNRCLDALRVQVCPGVNVEIIIVTDGPDIATVQAVKERDDHWLYSVHSPEEKRGPAAARNYGWRMACGELVLFTDDDCIPGPEWVRTYWVAYQVCVRQGTAGWQAGRALAFRGPVFVPCPERPTDHERNTAGLARAAFVTANCACTRLALEMTGGFDEDFAMAWREDSDLEFSLIRHSIPILHLSPAHVVHPVRTACWGISLREQKKSMYNALLYKKDPQLFREKIYSRPLWNYYAIIGSLATAVVAAIAGYWVLAAAAAGCWALLTGAFIVKRLNGASLAFPHVAEMVATSLLIPFLSLYWTWYG